MMPASFKMSEVISIIRKNLKIGRDQGLFLLAQGKHVMKANASLVTMYDKYKDQDGFLYIVYAEENIYGWWLYNNR